GGTAPQRGAALHRLSLLARRPADDERYRRPALLPSRSEGEARPHAALLDQAAQGRPPRAGTRQRGGEKEIRRVFRDVESNPIRSNTLCCRPGESRVPGARASLSSGSCPSSK